MVAVGDRSRRSLDFPCRAAMEAKSTGTYKALGRGLPPGEPRLGCCFPPCLPGRHGFSFRRQLSVLRSEHLTAKFLWSCESLLCEEGPTMREGCWALAGTPGTLGRWRSSYTGFSPIAMSLRSITAVMRRAAANPAHRRSSRTRLQSSKTYVGNRQAHHCGRV
jgi:hypothetical protein